jgi:hypothetical protein
VLHGTEVDSGAANNLQHPLYLWIVQVVTLISPLIMGLLWKEHEIKILPKAEMLRYRRTCVVFLKRGPAILANHPRELVFPTDVKHLAKVKDKQAQDVPKCKVIQINLH